MDLLISYPWGRFAEARREAVRILQRFGDEGPEVKKSGVPGIAVAHSRLDNREVIRRCRALYEVESVFYYTLKWVPVDFWCTTSLDVIRQAIADNVVDRIGEHERWGMRVKKRTWQRYHTREIIEYIAEPIHRTVDLTNPDWIVRVDVLGQQTAVSLLRPDEVFSIGSPYP